MQLAAAKVVVGVWEEGVMAVEKTDFPLGNKASFSHS